MSRRYRRRNGRARAMIGALAVLALVITACGNGDTTATDTPADNGDEEPSPADGDDNGEAAASGELTYLFGDRSAERAEPLVEAWREYRPESDITFLDVPNADLNNVIEARIGAGESLPDVYSVDQPRVAALVERGFLLDLTDELGDYEDQWLPATTEAGTVDGRLYAAPVSTTTQYMYLNVDLLEAAGVEVPSASPEDRWTWDETLEAARAAQEAGAEWGMQFEQVSRIYQLQPLAESLGGGSGLAGDDFLTPALANEGWYEAMELWQGIHEEGVAPTGVSQPEIQEMFDNGQLAIFIGGPWNLGRIDGTDDLGFEYAVAAHPYFDGGEPVTPTGAWSLGVNPNSENIEEAIEFVRFFTQDPDGLSAWLDPRSQHPIPAHNDSLDPYFDTDLFQQDFGGTTLAELSVHELNETAVVRPRSAGFVIYEEVVGRALEDIRNGEAIEETLQRAESELEDALARR